MIISEHAYAKAGTIMTSSRRFGYDNYENERF